jgi:hypothetical protein
MCVLVHAGNTKRRPVLLAIEIPFRTQEVCWLSGTATKRIMMRMYMYICMCVC